MGEVKFYKIMCMKIEHAAGVEVHGWLDVQDGCPWKGYKGINWCPGCLRGEDVKDEIVEVSVDEYDELGYRFPDID